MIASKGYWRYITPTRPRYSCNPLSWLRHQMETFSALLALVRGIYRSPVNSPHKGQWRGALMLSLICIWINGWVNNREASDLRRHRAHYDVIVMGPGVPYIGPTISIKGPCGMSRTSRGYNRFLMVLYVFEHKTQHLLIHAPYTRIIVLWYTSNIPSRIS